MNVVKATVGREEGFSLLGVLIISLVMIVASIAAIQRSGNGLFGSLFNTQSKEARETAESGITEIIGTLNQSDNRGLLISGVSPQSWETTNNPVLQNPCNDKVDPTATAAAIGATGTKLAGGEANQSYFLKSISFTSVDGATGARSTRTFSRADSATAAFSTTNTNPPFNPADISLNGDRKGYLTVVVVGQVVRGNTVISSAEITREFQVVPKCCKKSFGYSYADPANPIQSHGSDLRTCTVDGISPLVVGAGGDGVWTNKGNSLTLYRPNAANPLKTIASLNDAEVCNPVSDCQIGWGGNTTLLKPDNLELPPLPPTPPVLTGQGCITSAVTLPYGGGVNPATNASDITQIASTGSLCSDSTVLATQIVWQFQNKAKASSTGKGKSKVTTYTCTPATLTLGSALPGGAITVDSSLANETLNSTGCYSQTSRNAQQPDPYCRYNSTSSPPGYDCIIRYIAGSGADVKVDSTNAPVRVYMYDADGTSPVNGGTISFRGSRGISHVKCGSYSASCTTDAAIADASRFQMYGNIDDQAIDLRGNTNALAGFFYFPFADLQLRGGGGALNFSGILWTNNITVAGNIDFSLPSVADTTIIICAIYPGECDSSTSNNSFRPKYDFVARSVSSTRLFN